MSVTIVSTLPKSAPAAGGETAPAVTGSARQAGSQDFLSLLLGQLTPSVDGGMLPPSKEAEGEDTAEPALLDATNANQVNVFAALGILPKQDIEPAVDNPRTDHVALTSALQSDKIISDKSGTQLPAAEPPEIPTIAQPVTTSSSPLDIQNKAAKFAVEPYMMTSAESSTAKEVAAEPMLPISTDLNSSAASRTATQPRETVTSLPTPVRDPNWSQDFSQKIVWMATGDKQSAQITLNPPQMGPIEVSLNVDKGNATATFVSANAEVRETIETAIPRLREMLASAGIELGQANVSAESFRQQAENGTGHPGTSRNQDDRGILGTEMVEAMPNETYALRRGNGLVDLFA